MQRADEDDWSTKELVAQSFERFNLGANETAIKERLPLTGAHQSALISYLYGEIALSNGLLPAARRLFDDFTRRRPYIADGHRKQAAVAFAQGRWRDAARHIEAVTILRQHRWLESADLGRNLGHVAQLGETLALYWYDGKMVAVPLNERTLGVTVSGNRLIRLQDTRGFRFVQSIRQFGFGAGRAMRSVLARARAIVRMMFRPARPFLRLIADMWSGVARALVPAAWQQRVMKWLKALFFIDRPNKRLDGIFSVLAVESPYQSNEVAEIEALVRAPFATVCSFGEEAAGGCPSGYSPVRKAGRQSLAWNVSGASGELCRFY